MGRALFDSDSDSNSDDSSSDDSESDGENNSDCEALPQSNVTSKSNATLVKPPVKYPVKQMTAMSSSMSNSPVKSPVKSPPVRRVTAMNSSMSFHLPSPVGMGAHSRYPPIQISLYNHHSPAHLPLKSPVSSGYGRIVGTIPLPLKSSSQTLSHFFKPNHHLLARSLTPQIFFLLWICVRVW